MNKEELKQLEDDLWRSADTLRANSDLKSSEYSTPVLGLIFLKFADNKYRRHEKQILSEYAKLKGTRREKPVSEIAIEKCGFYLPDHTRYDCLLKLPDKEDIPIVSSSGVSSFHNQWKSKGPGVVIGRKGTLGTVHYLKGNFWPHDTTLWVKDFKGNSPRSSARSQETSKNKLLFCLNH